MKFLEYHTTRLIMGNELSRADLLESSLSDQEYFEKFFLLFSDKIDSYRSYDMTLYHYVKSNLDVLLILSRQSCNQDFVERCCESQGEYYTLEIIQRIRDISDLVEWISHEYSIVPYQCSPLLLQHPIFYVDPPLELILKNMERIIRWYKRYNNVLSHIDQYPDAFSQKFFFSCCCDAIAEKVKLIQ